MKKRLLALVMACTMVFAMTACGKKEDETTEVNFEKPEVETPDVVVPDVEVPDVEVSGTEEQSTAGSNNEITIMNLISLSLAGTAYEEYSAGSNASTKVFAENNQLQTIAMSAVSTAGMTGVEEQFKAQIESVYGTQYVTYDSTFNGITYTTYDFGTNNTMSSDINVTAYVYVGDGVAIYCEEAWATMLGSSSGDTETVLNTITIL